MVLSVTGSIYSFHCAHKPHMFCLHLENDLRTFGVLGLFRCRSSCNCFTCMYCLFISLPFACIPQLCCVQAGYTVCDNMFEAPTTVCRRNMVYLCLPCVCFPITCLQLSVLKPCGSYDIHKFSLLSSKISPIDT
jgi:hypothetical protein